MKTQFQLVLAVFAATCALQPTLSTAAVGISQPGSSNAKMVKSVVIPSDRAFPADEDVIRMPRTMPWMIPGDCVDSKSKQAALNNIR